MGAGQYDAGKTSVFLYGKHIEPQAFAGAIVFSGNRFVREHDAHGPAKVDVNIPALKALDHAAYDLAFLAAPLIQYRIALGFPQSLQYGLLRDLRRNASKVLMGLQRERY